MQLPTLKERQSLLEAANRLKEINRKAKEAEKKKEEEARRKAEIDKARPKISQIKKGVYSAVIEAVQEGFEKAYARTFGTEKFVWSAAADEIKSENPEYTVEFKQSHKFIEYHHNDMHYSPDEAYVFETALVISWKNS